MALEIGNKVENNGLSSNGRLTAEEFNALIRQVNLNTPKELESPEAHQILVDSGAVVEGQVYFTAEEDDI